MQADLDYLYNLERFGIKPGLAVMERMMELLGHPERAFKSIHVTGTNGKGSTCAMLESMLREAGYKTALYTSPHLHVFHERVRINGVFISDDDLVKLVQEIKILVEENALQPTFFEFTTALALVYFARASVDIALIEVGMGGRYDATNVITPLVSVITNIGLDHMEYLGPTTAHIAREKAGIIKEGVPVVTCEDDPNMLEIFNGEARQKHTSVIRVKDVVKAELISSDFNGQILDVWADEWGDEIRVSLPLLGSHQIKNMATAIATLAALQPSLRLWPAGTPISSKNISSGIAKTVWEGRMQIISHDPLIIVDGAHNPDGAKVLMDYVGQLPRHDVIVFAAKKGKDISDMLSSVIPLFSHIIVTKGSYMPEEAVVLASRMTDVAGRVYVKEDIREALALGTSLLPEHGTLLVTGSLYMIGDALDILTSAKT